MSENKAERGMQADDIVLNHTLSAMGMGLFPFPNVVLDVFAVTTVQINMIRQLCKVYDIEFKKSLMKGVVSSLTGSTLARIGAGSLAKFIPGLGMVAVPILAGGSTYAVGEIFKEHFASGGTILDIDLDRLKKQYSEKFEKGRKVATKLKEKKDKMFTHVEEAAESAGEYVSDMAEDIAEEISSTAEKVEDAVEELNFFGEDDDKAKKKDKAPDAKAAKQKQSQEEILGRLRELGDLKEKGILSEEEFAKMKQRLLDSF